MHLPLQSGDNGILRRMGRPYTRDQFSNVVVGIRKHLPDAAIGADVMVGFPGESRQAFDNTVSLIESLPLTYLHVFPFSPREGTPAYGYRNRVDIGEVQARCRRLSALGRRKKREFQLSCRGATARVLIEGRHKKSPTHCKGLTSNYIPVLLETERSDLAGRMIRVTLNRPTPDGYMLAIPCD